MNVKQKNWRQAVGMIAEDLHLFSSLCLARLIVWRTLRSERKRLEFRGAGVRLIHGGSFHWR